MLMNRDSAERQAERRQVSCLSIITDKHILTLVVCSMGGFGISVQNTSIQVGNCCLTEMGYCALPS